MHLKREISTSVSDLHLATVSDSIKRLKIAKDGIAVPMPLTIRKPTESSNLVHVMSSARDDFAQRYEIIREVGKGGFSTVYQCRNRQTGADYAVKVVDLRPLRLRERFNPQRLKREVEIMSRLHHPNIIQFIEVYEDADHLMMVMEYCPGKELFDVILARKYLQEEEAKPIFQQIALALFYLHSLNIIHRDIKPENILILDYLDPKTGNVIAKLLDFGLSKNAGAGSEAKTFVGTPCYLAPEVEYTSKGLGGTYGLAADCWSLGAVLYVMLVARFPEFEADINGKVVVKLAPALWQNVSSEAKELIRSLMNTNPNARMTMFGALQHPWLGKYRIDEKELMAIYSRNNQLNHELQKEADLEAEQEATMNVEQSQPEITAAGTVIRHHAMVVRQNHDPTSRPVTANNPDNNTNSNNNNTNQQGFGPESLKLAPLLHLQRSIASCFEEAHAEYHEFPEVASQIRRGAVLCRHQLVESTKMLRKVEQTAKEVLEMFPDLELAVEEDEPKLAAEFFNIVKGWVIELREQVTSTQKINKASMNQIQRVVEQSTLNLKESVERHKQQQQAQAIALNNNIPTALLAKQLVENLLQKIRATAPTNAQGQIDLSNVQLDANSVLELFMSLFNSPSPTSNQLPPAHAMTHVLLENGSSTSASSVGYSPPQTEHRQSNVNNPNSQSQKDFMDIDGDESLMTIDHMKPHQTTGSSKGGAEGAYSSRILDIDEDSMSLPPPAYPVGTASTTTTVGSAIPPPPPSISSPSVKDPPLVVDTDLMANDDAISNLTESNSIATQQQQLTVAQANKNEVAVRSPRTSSTRLSEALHKLRQVDVILEQLGIFWANTEVVLDLLTKKGQHVEQFIGFSSKPRLMARFRERMEEYKRFWEGIRLMCANYVAGIHSTNEQQKMYGFLEESSSLSSAKGDSLDSLLGSGGGVSSLPSTASMFLGLDGSLNSTFDPTIDEFKALKVKP